MPRPDSSPSTGRATLSRAALVAGLLLLLVAGGLFLQAAGGDDLDGSEQPEHPLPAWARFTIVGTSLVAFFAVSLVATRSV